MIKTRPFFIVFNKLLSFFNVLSNIMKESSNCLYTNVTNTNDTTLTRLITVYKFHNDHLWASFSYERFQRLSMCRKLFTRHCTLLRSSTICVHNICNLFKSYINFWCWMSLSFADICNILYDFCWAFRFYYYSSKEFAVSPAISVPVLIASRALSINMLNFFTFSWFARQISHFVCNYNKAFPCSAYHVPLWPLQLVIKC